MPRPIYLLCSQSNAIDKDSNFISFFNLIEEIRIAKIKEVAQPGKPPSQPPPLCVRIVSAWMREEGDSPEHLFETEIAITFPRGNEAPQEDIISRATLSFPMSLHRLISPDFLIPGFHGPGTMYIRCRLRRKGETEWLHRQEYPILLIEADTATAKDEAPPQNDNKG